MIVVLYTATSDDARCIRRSLAVVKGAPKLARMLACHEREDPEDERPRQRIDRRDECGCVGGCLHI
jgi:hypothetical protein